MNCRFLMPIEINGRIEEKFVKADVESEDYVHAILDSLKDVADRYSFASVADLKDFIGQPSYYPEGNIRYSWHDIDSVVVRTDEDGYVAKFPIRWSKDGKTVGESLTPKNDPVNHPNHYKSETGLEAIDVIEAFTSDLKGIEATDTGNIIKYICRWKRKNGLQDLKKAQWYLNHLINHVEKMEKENENHE